jgi:hypothetical protein
MTVNGSVKPSMTLIHPEEAGISRGAGELKPDVPFVESSPAPPPVESIPVITKSAEPIHSPVPEPQSFERSFSSHVLSNCRK